MKITKYALAVVVGLMCLMLPSALRADDFTFSITNTGGSVAGTITGEILGLTNNATSAGTVVITNVPTAFATDPDFATPPIDTSNWSHLGNVSSAFTETNGVITAAQYDVISPTGFTTFQIFFNSPLSFNVGDVIYGGGILSGSPTFAPLAAVPEPSSLLLLGTGLLALVGAIRWKRLA